MSVQFLQKKTIKWKLKIHQFYQTIVVVGIDLWNDLLSEKTKSEVPTTRYSKVSPHVAFVLLNYKITMVSFEFHFCRKKIVENSKSIIIVTTSDFSCIVFDSISLGYCPKISFLHWFCCMLLLLFQWRFNFKPFFCLLLRIFFHLFHRSLVFCNLRLLRYRIVYPINRWQSHTGNQLRGG